MDRVRLHHAIFKQSLPLEQLRYHGFEPNLDIVQYNIWMDELGDL